MWLFWEGLKKTERRIKNSWVTTPEGEGKPPPQRTLRCENPFIWVMGLSVCVRVCMCLIFFLHNPRMGISNACLRSSLLGWRGYGLCPWMFTNILCSFIYMYDVTSFFRADAADWEGCWLLVCYFLIYLQFRQFSCGDTYFEYMINLFLHKLLHHHMIHYFDVFLIASI